jgi:transcriptional regulator with GAF, ATPase, and Fis domain
VINTNGPVLRIRENLELVEFETKRARTLTEVERDYITDLLEDCGWRVEGEYGAARILGLNPSTLRSKMSKLGIKR